MTALAAESAAKADPLEVLVAHTEARSNLCRDVRSRSHTKLCPTCHRPWPEVRLGVPLTPLKVRIFDAIRRAGPNGIAGDAIIQELGLPVSRATLKAHVWQINERLAESGYQIVGRGGYRLQSPPNRAS
jgi:hypothetical protein